MRYGFDADDTERVLPKIVRRSVTGEKQISYDDLIGLVTLGAKERQEQLDAHEQQEALESMQIQQQDNLIEELESQISAVRGRFVRLHQRGGPLSAIS